MSSTDNQGWSKGLSSFDLFPKLSDEVRIKTYSGAAISIIAGILISALIISEFNAYLSPQRVDRLFVDHTSRTQKLPIAFDLSFPNIPCPLLTLQTMDVAGTSQLDIEHSIIKNDILPSGKIVAAPFVYNIGQDVPFSQQTLALSSLGDCGRCFGGEENSTQCCNTCEDIQKAFQKKKKPLPLLENFPQCVGGPSIGTGQVQAQDNLGVHSATRSEPIVVNTVKNSGKDIEKVTSVINGGPSRLFEVKEMRYGCRISGEIHVSKVAGNFIFSPGRQYQTEEDVYSTLFQSVDFDMSHTIHSLRFGRAIPGTKDPLDGYKRDVSSLAKLSEKKTAPENASFMYYAKVVPTVYNDVSDSTILSNQFSVTEHQKALQSNEPNSSANQGSGAGPVFAANNSSVVFFYELSPIMVQATVRWKPFFSFITQLCAILGGVFTVASIVDKLVYGSVQHVQKKIQLGKLN